MSLDREEVMSVIENDEMAGFCIECGERHDNIEPDARQYLCEYCEKNTVYGAEEILLMGLLE